MPNVWRFSLEGRLSDVLIVLPCCFFFVACTEQEQLGCSLWGKCHRQIRAGSASTVQSQWFFWCSQLGLSLVAWLTSPNLSSASKHKSTPAWRTTCFRIKLPWVSSKVQITAREIAACWPADPYPFLKGDIRKCKLDFPMFGNWKNIITFVCK